MGFVNEVISKEDFEKYKLKEIDSRYITGCTNSRGWTIDRSRDIYLRKVARGREEFAKESTWVLYWLGELIEIKLELIDFRKKMRIFRKFSGN